MSDWFGTSAGGLLDKQFFSDMGTIGQGGLTGANYLLGKEGMASDFMRDQLVNHADQELQNYNKTNKKITTQDMTSHCPQCALAMKQGQTINNLKVDHNAGGGANSGSNGYSFELKAAAGFGVKGSIDGKVGYDEVSGTYYYIDKRQHWIKVTADHAERGKSVDATTKLSGVGEGGPIGGEVGLPKTSTGEIEPGKNFGLPR